MFDCVVGYYLNPLSSGVAKFNAILAERWGVPVVQLFDPELIRYQRPLLSIKLSDMPEQDVVGLGHLLGKLGPYGFFVHALAGGVIEERLIAAAATVYCGNSQIKQQIETLAPSARLAWSPPTLRQQKDLIEADINVFTFGMAHKIDGQRYRRLKELLEDSGRDYCLYVSTALHESEPLIHSFDDSHRELDDIFEGRTNFMGYLSDRATVHFLRRCTFFAAFFENGVRANNSSVVAALAAGSVVLTNLDKFSPSAYVHGVNIIDINRCQELTVSSAELATISKNARAVGSDELSWNRLDKILLEP